MSKKFLNYQASTDASKFRRLYDLGEADPISFDSLLLKLDLTTIFAEVSGSFSGMAAKLEGDRFMLINCSHPKGRQHFTIGHELYHLFIQDNFSFEANTGNSENGIEKLANQFSNELLMPQAGIKEILSIEDFLKKRISLDEIIKLEQYFQVSRSAMLVRLLNLKFINQDEYEAYKSDVKISAQIRGYSTDLYEPTMPRVVSSDYHEKAKKLYQKSIIGLTDYAQLMSDIDIDVFQLNDTTKEE